MIKVKQWLFNITLVLSGLVLFNGLRSFGMSGWAALLVAVLAPAVFIVAVFTACDYLSAKRQRGSQSPYIQPLPKQ